MLLLNLLALLTFSHSSDGSKFMPVFILDYDQALTDTIMNNNPFHKTIRGEFTDIVHDVIRKSDTIIIFTETLFCSEYVSTRDKEGTAYPNMRKALHEQKVKYLPAVEEPYSILTQIFGPDPLNTYNVSLCNVLELNLNLGHSKYFYVYFQDDSDNPRTEILRCHDAIMKEVYLQTRMLKPPGRIVGFYTGLSSPIIVERRLLKPTKTEKEVESVPTVFLSSDGALFRFKGIYFTRGKTATSLIEMPFIAEETWTKQKLTTKMSYSDFELQFEFSFRSDGWSLDSVSLLEAKEVMGTLRMGIGAPWGYSYVCSDPLIISGSDNGFVSINHYQIQPFRNARRYLVVPYGDRNIQLEDSQEDEDGPEPIPDMDVPGRTSTARFGKSVHCGPYFSISILSCLFVSALLLGVLTAAVVMLMNCKTNDRYDDPHGKQLHFTSEL